MNLHRVSVLEATDGQATFGMANLRMERTGLPFIVFISQKDDAQHDIRVKVSPAPRIRPDQMSSYALRPFRLVEGNGMTSHEEAQLRRWVELNFDTLVGYWDGHIEYTEDALDRLQRV